MAVKKLINNYLLNNERRNIFVVKDLKKMSEVKPEIEESWRLLLMTQFQAEYFKNLKEFLIKEKQQYTVYPPGSYIFNAFNLTPFDNVKVVILGQDPYHGKGQAHGLCFSVPLGVEPPPSLKNIYKELNSDLGVPIPNHGCLEKWAKQGVFLLNTILTVRADQPLSHQNKGWEKFTDYVIQLISDLREGVVFLLWGKKAQEKIELIDTTKHYVLQAAHPSPLSANAGFFGCKHFSKTNELLRMNGLAEIDWSL